MTLKLSVGACPKRPVYGADDGAHIAALYAEKAVEGGVIPAPICQDIAPSVAASVVIRAVVQAMGDGEITLLCASEEEVTLYRQMYNLWFAGTKDERL